MSDYLVSIIRTLVPVGVGALLGWLARYGVGISEGDSEALTVAFVGIAISAYYAAARAAEGSRSPWLATVGRFLLGGVARTPVYVSSKPDPDRYGD